MVSTSLLVNKIFTFCEELGKDHLIPFGSLFPFQAQFAKRLIRSLLENDGEEISALFSRQSGKSTTIAIVVAGCSILLPIMANMPMFKGDLRLEQFQRGLTTGIFAPAMHQSQIVFGKVKDILSTDCAIEIMEHPEINARFDTNNGQNVVIRLANIAQSSVITCMSASETSNIVGKTYMLIIVDEAQDVSNSKYSKDISPMGAFFNATKVLIGTPGTVKGFFFEAIERNKRDYLSKTRAKNHYENDYKVVIKYNPKYAKYIEGEKKKLGEKSDAFQMAYCLKWLLSRGMFVDSDKFESYGLTDEEICENGDTENVHVVGIDLAKEHDSTVVTVLEVDWENPIIVEESKDKDVPDYIVYNTKVKGWLEIQGDNWNEQYYQIKDYLALWKIERCVIDATGVGSPVYDRLAAVLPYECIPYVYSTPSKSELFKFYDSQIKSGRFKYPAGEKTKETPEYQGFMEQHLDAEKSYSGQHMCVSHSDKRDAHDDYVSSAALGVWGAKGEVTKPHTSKENIFLSKSKAANSFYYSRNRLTAARR
jgi:hypothetical protein